MDNILINMEEYEINIYTIKGIEIEEIKRRKRAARFTKIC